MHRLIRSTFIAALLAAVWCIEMNSQAAAASRIRALLVGCTDYPFLPDVERWKLIGPGNDVEIFRAALLRFGLDPASTIVLKGWPEDTSQRPTRANIQAAFARFARESASGDQVIILMAGHGSQQPVTPQTAPFEPDGLDETFLPADTKGWDGQVGQVENAIIDDEIGQWLDAIRAKGAFVWIVFDCCHAGTMTRGVAARERYRYIPAGVLVPQAALDDARKQAAAKPAIKTPVEPTRGGDTTAAPGGLVAMYACQSTELAPEMLLPPEADDYHGLFTYTLVQNLLSARGTMTYRELAGRISATYRAMDRWQPSPSIDGSSLDRQVMGASEWPQRPQILLAGPAQNETSRGAPDARVKILAGSLHGLRPGTILAVYPPAGSPDPEKVLGHLRLATIEPMASWGEPVAYAGNPASPASALIAGSRCAPVYVELAELKMRVALQVQEEHSDKAITCKPGQGPPALEEALSRLAEAQGSLLQRTDSETGPDWLVRLKGGQVALIPSAGWSQQFAGSSGAGTAGAPPQFRLGSLSEPDKLKPAIEKSLTTIARARHLLQLASPVADADTSRQDDVAIGLDLLRYRDRQDPKAEVVQCGAKGRVLEAGHWVAFQVKNRGRQALDLTLLFVDSGYGIHALFPTPGAGADNRLEPGKSFTTPRIRVTADTVGAEQVVAIAVKSGQGRADFSCLAQPTLERLRGGPGVAAMNTPLGSLLQSALYGQGQTRGLAAAEVETYAVRLLPWITVPAGFK